MSKSDEYGRTEIAGVRQYKRRKKSRTRTKFPAIVNCVPVSSLMFVDGFALIHKCFAFISLEDDA